LCAWRRATPNSHVVTFARPSKAPADRQTANQVMTKAARPADETPSTARPPTSTLRDATPTAHPHAKMKSDIVFMYGRPRASFSENETRFH
jgi:hypothetical protein